MAENARKLDVPPELVGCIFALLVKDMNEAAMGLAASGVMPEPWVRRMLMVPREDKAGWALMLERAKALA